MSGSGGGGGPWRSVSRQPNNPENQGGGEGADGASAFSCDITEDTRLNSVARDALQQVDVDDRLDVVYQTDPYPRLIVRNSARAIVGSITSSRMQDIIRCIEEGYSYVAMVRSIHDGQCSIRIERQ